MVSVSIIYKFIHHERTGWPVHAEIQDR